MKGEFELVEGKILIANFRKLDYLPGSTKRFLELLETKYVSNKTFPMALILGVCYSINDLHLGIPRFPQDEEYRKKFENALVEKNKILSDIYYIPLVIEKTFPKDFSDEFRKLFKLVIQQVMEYRRNEYQ